MARPARPWFRFYVEAMRDPKMRRLTPAERWLWVSVLSAARESFQPGHLWIAEGTPFTVEDLADYAGMRAREVDAGMEKMLKLGLIGGDPEVGFEWFVRSWKDRQYESDDVAARVRKHRSQTADRNGDETFQKEDSNTPDTETDTETELIKEPRKRKPVDNFLPTEAHGEYADKNGLRLEDERLAWLDWCEANGRTYANLNAGFSTWLRQAVNFGRGKGGPTTVYANGKAVGDVSHLTRCPKCAATGNYMRAGVLTICDHRETA